MQRLNLDQKGQQDNMTVLLDLLKIKPEIRTKSQNDSIYKVSKNLPFFLSLQRQRPFTIDEVVREMSKDMRLIPSKAHFPLVRAGSFSSRRLSGERILFLESDWKVESVQGSKSTAYKKR